MKKLLSVLMTMAIAAVLGMGTVGCSKKEQAKTTTTTEKATTDAGSKSGTEKVEKTTTETKTDAAKTNPVK